MTDKPVVLCVDDEPNVLKSYRRALRNEPYEVLFAANAQEALTLMQTRSVHAVMTDFRMPGMNGVELLKKIKAMSPKTVCGILSGFADEATVQDALRQGDALKFLLKPIDNQELRKEVKGLVSKYDRT